jgi:hypothetical protein
MESNVRLSPFEILDLQLQITLRSMNWTTDDGHKVYIKFNLMDFTESSTAKFSLHGDGNVGEYGLVLTSKKA